MRTACATGAVAGMLWTGIALAQSKPESQAAPQQSAPDPQDTTDQTVDDGGATPAASLDLPSNLQIFGNANPDVRKPTAVVNNTVITQTDVDQRYAMVVALNKIDVRNKQEEQQLRLQILRSLIDETLEVQEAAAHDITISPEEITASFNRVGNRFNMTSDEFAAYLTKIGSSPASLRRQIQGEMAWSRLLARRVEPQVNVSDEEVDAILQRMKESRGTEEYHLKEIYLRATEADAQQVYNTEKQMIDQMKNGAPFEYLARTQSQATTAAVGGDLGWVRSAVLPPSMAQAAQEMQIGQIAGPVQTPGGFSLLYLADKRQVLTASPRDAKLSLRQMTVNFTGLSKPQAEAKAAEFAKAVQSLKGCGSVSKVAAQIGAEVVDNDQLQVKDLPPQLQDMILKMKVGEATPAFGTIGQGARAIVLCGRDDPQQADLPSAEQIRSQLEQKRVNLRAQRMLRDLRRDAVIEYR